MADKMLIGSRASVECDFRVAGGLTDPDVVVATTRAPSGDAASYTYPQAELVRDAPGVYRCEFTLDQAGDWWVRFTGSGGVEAVNETCIHVEPSNVL